MKTLKTIGLWSTVIITSAFVGAVAQTVVTLLNPRLGQYMKDTIDKYQTDDYED